MSFTGIFLIVTQNSFGRPQVGGSCESFNKILRSKFSNYGEKQITTEKMMHIRRSKKFNNEMTSDGKQKNDTLLPIVFDYMQNMFTYQQYWFKNCFICHK